MHYYTFHAKDYAADTVHLTNEEDLAYRRLIDLAFNVEGAIPGTPATIARRIRIPAEAVESVLQEFWEQTSEGYIQKRVVEELLKIHHYIEEKRMAAQSRWAKWRSKQSSSNADAMHVHSTSNAEAMQNDAEGMLPNYPLTQSITIEAAEEFLRGLGYPTDAVREWHAHRESQNWEKSSGVRITNWQSDLKSWVYRNARTAKANGSKPPEKSKYANEF
jgi:uncharacterized protein YdaU (DUF1376 family)